MNRKVLTGITIGAVAVMAVVALSGCTTAGLADNGSEVTVPEGSTVVINSQTEGIWVSGTGEITITPDVATLRVGVESQAATVVNIGVLEKNFDNNDVVSPQTLLDKKLIDKIKGVMPEVKILANGNLSKALNIEGCQLSKAAEENITKAKGKIKHVA